MKDSYIPLRIAKANGYKSFEKMVESAKEKEIIISFPSYLKSAKPTESFCKAVKDKNGSLKFDEHNNLVLAIMESKPDENKLDDPQGNSILP